MCVCPPYDYSFGITNILVKKHPLHHVFVLSRFASQSFPEHFKFPVLQRKSLSKSHKPGITDSDCYLCDQVFKKSKEYRRILHVKSATQIKSVKKTPFSERALKFSSYRHFYPLSCIQNTHFVWGERKYNSEIRQLKLLARNLSHLRVTFSTQRVLVRSL